MAQTTQSLLKRSVVRLSCAVMLTAVTLLPAEAHRAPDAPTGGRAPDALSGLASTDPDFGSIDDPLGGDLELFSVDDLVAFHPKQAGVNKDIFTGIYRLHTADQTIVSQQVSTGGIYPCWLANGTRQPQVTRVGRFFSLPYDTWITLQPSDNAKNYATCTSPDQSPNMYLTVGDDLGPPTSDPDTAFTMSPYQTAMAMDDFNQDGFPDLFIMSDSDVRVATASNLSTWTSGMKFGSVTHFISTSMATITDPTTGDFNGDGLKDVAWIDQTHKVRFATVCPNSTSSGVCAGKTALDVVLNPLAASGTVIDVPNENGQCLFSGYGDVTLTSGDYGGTGQDGLMTFQLTALSQFNCGYFAYWYEFNTDFSLASGTYQDRHEIATQSNFTSLNTYAASTSLGVIGPEQAVFAAGGTNGDGNLAEMVAVIHVVGGKLAVQSISPEGPTACEPESQPCAWINGLALGRFAAVPDSQESDDIGRQIATLRNDGKLTIYSVDAPTDYTPKQSSQTTIDSGLYMPTRTERQNGFSWLVAGDLQGRSAHLGPPTILRVPSHSQPSIILGAPPMHVDYIKPDSSTSSDWTVVNISAQPTFFNSKYTMSQNQSNQSSDTNTTSYTYASSSETGGSLKASIPFVASIDESIQKSAEQKYETVNENNAFEQNEFRYDASTTTGVDDEIWYDESSFNTYLYPVLGRSACPVDLPNCSTSQMLPLYLIFSGPSNSTSGSADGSTTEWYQPVQEPGNIFSYPWTLSMLSQENEGGTQVLSGPLTFNTDSSTLAQSLAWSGTSGQEKSVGATNSHSYKKAYSVSAGYPLEEGTELGVSHKVDYSNSSSFASLIKSNSSVGASQGVGIAKSGTLRNPALYQYQISPVIFGQNPPAGLVDQKDLTQAITTTGPLVTAFVVDPTVNSAGSWWKSDVSPYKTGVDVALNHPDRWQYEQFSDGSQSGLNCLQSFPMDCMVFNDPNPDNLWNSEYYWMRGLFATVGGTNGPQRTAAKAGETVVLQARVYNYSFKDMDASSHIKVRFYRQPIVGTTPTGDSVLISEETVNPLPGFNSSSQPDQPNFTLVTSTTPLTTTELGGTYQIFWVVVWAEDGSGNLVAEVTGHGLSAKPGTLNGIGDVPLEPATFNGVQTSFSNNVGYLHSLFYILPSGAEVQTVGAQTTALRSSEAPAAEAKLELRQVQAEPVANARNGRVILGAEVFSAGAPSHGVHVRFYADARAVLEHEKDKSRQRPRAFDVESLPYIPVDGSGRVEIPYTPRTCGAQEVMVVAKGGSPSKSAKATVKLQGQPCRIVIPVAQH